MKALLNNFQHGLNWQLIILIAVVVIGAITLSRIIKWLIEKSFEKGDELDATRFKFFKNASSLIILV